MQRVNCVYFGFRIHIQAARRSSSLVDVFLFTKTLFHRRKEMKINTAESRENEGKLRCIGLHTCASGLFWHKTDAAPVRHERMRAEWEREKFGSVYLVFIHENIFSSCQVHRRYTNACACWVQHTFVCFISLSRACWLCRCLRQSNRKRIGGKIFNEKV